MLAPATPRRRTRLIYSPQSVRQSKSVDTRWHKSDERPYSLFTYTTVSEVQGKDRATSWMTSSTRMGPCDPLMVLYPFGR